MEELAAFTVIAEEYTVWGKQGTGIEKGGLGPGL
jgi:hypothetical protein